MKEEIDYFQVTPGLEDRMLDKMSFGCSREKIPANMMEYKHCAAGVSHSIIGVSRIIESHMEVKKFFLTDLVRFDMEHTPCYNLVKHVETHFKNLYIIF